MMRVMTCAVLLGLTASFAAAQGAGPILSSDGNWDLRKSDDPSSGGPACILTPRARSRIQIVGERVIVTGLPKDSIFNYQYRIDDNSTSNATIPSAAMQNEGVVSLDGDAFQDVLKGRRLQIRILDKWHEAITEDVSLAGLRSLYESMKAECK